jgi:DNA polymerase III alpha subunit
MPDIDLDFSNRLEALSVLKHVKASRKTNDDIVAHNTGIYFQSIPHNPITNLSSIDYKEADKRGYFKIDFLNVNIYNNILSEDHLNDLMNTEPVWELLEHKEFVDKLFHLNGYHELLKKLKPTSVEQLAAILAIIRPAKKYLIDESWDNILKEVWTKTSEEDGYAFKKAHSYSYAFAIIVQMNLICQEYGY